MSQCKQHIGAYTKVELLQSVMVLKHFLSKQEFYVANAQVTICLTDFPKVGGKKKNKEY